jgi:hypothetical protein
VPGFSHDSGEEINALLQMPALQILRRKLAAAKIWKILSARLFNFASIQFRGRRIDCLRKQHRGAGRESI